LIGEPRADEHRRPRLDALEGFKCRSRLIAAVRPLIFAGYDVDLRLIVDVLPNDETAASFAVFES